MAVLEKIRSVQWLLFLALILLGIGMLGFLVPYDAVLSLIGKGQNRSVATLDGASINAQEYQIALQRRGDLFNYQNRQALENEVWNDMIEMNLLGDDYRALGLDVTKEEFDEIRFGEHLSPWVQRTFYGGGVTDEAKANWRSEFSAMYNDDQGIGRNNYLGYADVIVQKRLREKYDAMVTRGLYANSLEAKYDYKVAGDKVAIEYVFVKYSDVADSLVNVSESDVRGYYNKHKNDPEYEQITSRDLEYIKIPVEPSQADIDRINGELQTIADEWRTLDSDSAWVSTRNNGRYVSRTLKETAATTDQDKAFFTAEIGTIFGPYDENGVSKVSKVVRITDAPDSTVSCRHILLKANSTNDEAEMATLMARADSLKRRYKAGEDWDDLCARFSEDPGSKDKGGKYENFPRGQMVKPFEEYCFDNSPGSIGAVETSFGVHLIEVLDQRWSVPSAELAEITREIKPSTDTQKAAYKEASEFSINYNNMEDFRTAADTLGYAVVNARSVRPNATSLAGGLQNAGEIVSFAFRSEMGEVSNPVLIDNNYVIAVVTKVMEAGVPPFENVEETMRDKAIEEAKADYYVEMLASANTLDEAAELAGVTVKNARNITLKSATIPGSGAGQEPIVAGLAFAIPAGNMSLPIRGESGVWVIAPSGDVIVVDEKDNYFTEQDQATNRLRSGAGNRVLNAMKEGADLEDERMNF